MKVKPDYIDTFACILHCIGKTGIGQIAKIEKRLVRDQTFHHFGGSTNGQFSPVDVKVHILQ